MTVANIDRPVASHDGRVKDQPGQFISPKLVAIRCDGKENPDVAASGVIDGSIVTDCDRAFVDLLAPEPSDLLAVLSIYAIEIPVPRSHVHAATIEDDSTTEEPVRFESPVTVACGWIEAEEVISARATARRK